MLWIAGVPCNFNHACMLPCVSQLNKFDSNWTDEMGIMNTVTAGEASDSRLLKERPSEKYGHSDVTIDSRLVFLFHCKCAYQRR